MLLVGKILRTHGIRGELKIESFMDTPEALKNIKKITVDGIEYDILSARVAQAFLIVKLKGIDSINSAEIFRNKNIYVKESDLPKLEDGRYYIHELLDCSVCNDEGNLIGILTDVLQHGAADVLVIENNGKIVMVPFVDNLLSSIDTSTKKISVSKKKFEEVAVYED